MTSGKKYSKREVELLATILSFGKKKVTLDEICERFEKENGESPARSSVASSIRHVEWKSRAFGEAAITKISGIGRGEKAVYSVLSGAKKIIDREGLVDS